MHRILYALLALLLLMPFMASAQYSDPYHKPASADNTIVTPTGGTAGTLADLLEVDGVTIVRGESGLEAAASFPSGDTGQLLGYTATGSTAAPITLGTGLALSGGDTLVATGTAVGVAGGDDGELQINSSGVLAGVEIGTGFDLTDGVLSVDGVGGVISIATGGTGSDVGNAGSLYGSALTIGSGGMYSFGDSITSIVSYTTTAQRWNNMVAADASWSVTSYAENSRAACDIAIQQVFPNTNPSQAKAPVYTYQTGHNDKMRGGTADYETGVFKPCVDASLAWLSIPSNHKVFAQSAACSETGTWTDDDELQAGIGRQSTDNGATLTCPITTNGGPIYIWHRTVNANNGTFTYNIDGAGAVALASKMTPAMDSSYGDNEGVVLTRIPSISAGDHSVVFTITSADDVGPNQILGIGTAPQEKYWSPPTVFVPNIHSVSPDTISYETVEGWVTTYNTVLENSIKTLAQDGLNVRLVDVRSYMNDTTDLGDTLHQSVAGHVKYRDAFESVMQFPKPLEGSGSGTVTSVSVATATGVSGTVATATTTPSITITLGAIQPTSVTTGAISGSTGLFSGTVTGNAFVGPLTGAVTGNASTASALASNPTDCSEGQFANAIAANGNLTCGSPAGGGTVTSVAVDVSALSGLTVTGTPITGTGTFVLGGTLGVANGGTGATTLTGYVKGNGTSAFSATATLAAADLSGTVPAASLPYATATTTGGVKVGTGLSMTDGVLAATGTGGGEMVYPDAGLANSTGTGWGTSYTVGTSANNIVQLTASAYLPAVDGSLLTNVAEATVTPTGGTAGTLAAKTAQALGYNLISKTDSYTLTNLADCDKSFISMGKGTAQTLTIPLNADLACPVGSEIIVYQSGAGALTVTATDGVTFYPALGSIVATGQYSQIPLKKTATNTWVAKDGFQVAAAATTLYGNTSTASATPSFTTDPTVSGVMTGASFNATTKTTGYILNGDNAIRFAGDNTYLAVGLGAAASATATGLYSTAVGGRTLGAHTSGASNAAFGFGAMRHFVSGANNTAVGSSAMGAATATTGSRNTVVGSNAGSLINGGSNNTILGYAVGSTTLVSGSNNILIGTGTVIDTPAADTSNYLIIGRAITATGLDTATPSVAIPGTLNVTGAITGSLTGNASTVTTNANLTGDVTSTGNATTLANSATARTNLGLGTAATYAATSFCQPSEIDGHAAASPTAASMKCGASIYNYGQAAADVNITLPTAEANLLFVGHVGTAQAANYWRFTAADAGTMYLDGGATGKNYVSFAAPAVGNYVTCHTFKSGASAYSWICRTGNGTVTTN